MHGATAEGGHLLQQGPAREPPGLMVRKADAADERVDVAHVAIVLGEAFEDRTGIEVDENPADVEDDGANQRCAWFDARLPVRANLSTGAAEASAFPIPHTADVDVNEVRFPVVADAALLEGEGKVPQPLGRDAGEPHVDGLALDVLAVFRLAAAVTAQLFVRVGRAVSRDDLIARLDPRVGCDVRQQDEEPRVHPAMFVTAVVAEDAVEPLEGFRDEARVVPEGDLQRFVRVGVVQLEPVGRWRRGIGIRRATAEQRKKRDEENYKGNVLTLPVSPGVSFTATTVALGKKLKSEALAHV